VTGGEAGTVDVVRAALGRLASGEVELVTLWVRRSTRRIRVSRIGGEPAVLCEVTTDDFLAPADRLGAVERAALDSLGLSVTPGTSVAASLDVRDGSGQARSVALVVAALEVLGQDPAGAPVVVDG
jgi:hypothetical protein